MYQKPNLKQNVHLKTEKNNQSGFSVIEVLITLFMIGVMLMLFQATANAIVLNKYGHFKEIALRIADQKIQEVRTTSFATIPSSGTFTSPLLATIPGGQASLTMNDLEDNLKEVIVVVRWNKPNNSGTQQVQLQTYIFQGGLGQ
jgi:prepilin-type N-terminal cleavage/methylation domain-containing protein